MKIINRFNKETISEFDETKISLKEKLEIEVAKNISLLDADLQDADLRDADLQYTNLQRADLQGANLRDADLQGANLRYTNLRDADLLVSFLEEKQRNDNSCG